MIDVLLTKTIKAAKEFKAKSVIVGGGVSANQELRRQFRKELKKKIINFLNKLNKSLKDAKAILGGSGAKDTWLKGVKDAEKITKTLVEHKVVVVSGLARGIDTVAHKTAIKYGGKTIAVLGTPLNRFYPPENRTLQELIMKEHLAISQYPIGN